MEIKWPRPLAYKLKYMKSFLNPNNILDQLDLKPDMVAAEFGCGSGGFTVPLANRLEDGLVYAIDILAEPLSALSGRMRSENIKNIKIVKGDLEKQKGSTLNDSCLDLAVIPNVLFQAEDKNAIISEAVRVLERRGKLVIIDWEDKVSKQDIKETAQKSGLEFEKELEAGKYHFGLLFKK